MNGGFKQIINTRRHPSIDLEDLDVNASTAKEMETVYGGKMENLASDAFIDAYSHL